jgi:hypothetical protein
MLLLCVLCGEFNLTTNNINIITINIRKINVIKSGNNAGFARNRRAKEKNGGVHK